MGNHFQNRELFSYQVHSTGADDLSNSATPDTQRTSPVGSPLISSEIPLLSPPRLVFHLPHPTRKTLSSRRFLSYFEVHTQIFIHSKEKILVYAQDRWYWVYKTLNRQFLVNNKGKKCIRIFILFRGLNTNPNPLNRKHHCVYVLDKWSYRR